MSNAARNDVSIQEGERFSCRNLFVADDTLKTKQKFIPQPRLRVVRFGRYIMKKQWTTGLVVILVVVNVLLLGALVHVNMTPARAANFKTTDYVMVTGSIGRSLEAVYIIDLASNKIAAFSWDKTAKRVKGIDRVRDLSTDFKQNTR